MVKKSDVGKGLVFVLALIIVLFGLGVVSVWYGDTTPVYLEDVDNTHPGLFDHRSVYGYDPVSKTTYVGLSVAINPGFVVDGNPAFPSTLSKLKVLDKCNDGVLVGEVQLGAGPYDYGPTSSEFGNYDHKEFSERGEVYYYWYDICIKGAPRELQVVISEAGVNTSDQSRGDFILTPTLKFGEGSQLASASLVKEGIAGCYDRKVYVGDWPLRTVTPGDYGQNWAFTQGGCGDTPEIPWWYYLVGGIGGIGLIGLGILLVKRF